ncbi:MAG: hypothetical protein DRO09_00025 [Thermoprotei archaeon]|nr:MAG: hypothetical protein DRO09_00025 [Thermoprotei archaeon]
MVRYYRRDQCPKCRFFEKAITLNDNDDLIAGICKASYTWVLYPMEGYKPRKCSDFREKEDA